MYQFGVCESKFLHHAFDISPLVDGDGAGSSITFDLEAKEPVEFAKVSDVIVAAEFNLETVDCSNGIPGYSHIIGSNHNNNMFTRFEFLKED